MPTLKSPGVASLGSRSPRSETEMGRVKSLASSRHHSRAPGFPDAATCLYHHYEVLQASHPGLLLDRLYVRLATPVGVVAPPRPRSSIEVPNFAQVPIGSFDEAVKGALKTTAGIEALDLFTRSAGRAGDPIHIVRRAVALRAIGKLTREESIQAYAVYLRERQRVPALEGLVGWLL